MSTTKAFFLKRLNDHIQYLGKIQATLDGKGDFQGTSHRDCKLGLWLYSEGEQEIHDLGEQGQALYSTLLDMHERFHSAGHEALEKHASGDPQGREAAVTRMHKLSSDLVNKLLALDEMSR